MDIREILDPQRHDDQFRYMLLDRMRSDCDYYLGNGRCYGNHLWAGNETDQIAYMKAIWASFPDDAKPEWLSMNDILTLEQRMLVHKAIKEYMARVADPPVLYPFTKVFHALSPEDLDLIEANCAGQTDDKTLFRAITAVIGKDNSLAPQNEEERA